MSLDENHAFGIIRLGMLRVVVERRGFSEAGTRSRAPDAVVD